MMKVILFLALRIMRSTRPYEGVLYRPDQLPTDIGTFFGFTPGTPIVIDMAMWEIPTVRTLGETRPVFVLCDDPARYHEIASTTGCYHVANVIEAVNVCELLGYTEVSVLASDIEVETLHEYEETRCFEIENVSPAGRTITIPANVTVSDGPLLKAA